MLNWIAHTFDPNVTLRTVSCIRDAPEREDVGVCPYTDLQGPQEVQVWDPLRPTTAQREVAVSQRQQTP